MTSAKRASPLPPLGRELSFHAPRAASSPSPGGKLRFFPFALSSRSNIQASAGARGCPASPRSDNRHHLFFRAGRSGHPRHRRSESLPDALCGPHFGRTPKKVERTYRSHRAHMWRGNEKHEDPSPLSSGGRERRGRARTAEEEARRPMRFADRCPRGRESKKKKTKMREMMNT